MIALGVLVIFFAYLTWALPIGRALEPLQTPTLVLLTADGKPFARRGSYKEAPVEADKLPAHIPNAFIAIEDRRFRSHLGVDLQAIARAAKVNADSGEVRQGGSTITQQLAKNAFLDNRRSLRRKAQEAIIAVYLEARLSKDEILSRYLSAVYFGDGVYGLGAAARHFFDKAPEQLTVGEAAMLAGVVKAPSRLAPTVDFKDAKQRAGVVLAAMVDQDMVTAKEAKASLAKVKLRGERARLPVGSYFADWIGPRVEQSFGRGYGEVKVWTTLDSQMQVQAQRAIRNGLKSGRRQGVTQAALVAMRTDGRVVALVGGADYKKSQFDRATDAKRQPGSAFKPFVYLAALRSGMGPGSTVVDAPIKIGNWSPQNYEGRYSGGPVTLFQAFSKSSNVASARLTQQVGVRRVTEAARDMGVTSDLPNDFTIALGTGEMTLLELTSAYAAIAAGQGPVTPRGLLIEQQGAAKARLATREREGLLTLMRGVVAQGTGTAANIGPQVFGKTGTSQDYRDAWFVGFAGDLVVGVWMGNDDNTPMKGVTGGSIPAQVWRDFMTYAMRRPDFPKGAVTVDDGPIIDFEMAELEEPGELSAELDDPFPLPEPPPGGPYDEPYGPPPRYDDRDVGPPPPRYRDAPPPDYGEEPVGPPDEDLMDRDFGDGPEPVLDEPGTS
ncbi:PBP1A family penicillin-binding protein [Caulobacter sp. SLTY]|uniref:PBP1A family penicillin-binding protein n=1 Tax=Caulobacter sp. SLTY TaxID=2683262 RepID=UPI001411B3D3|nr:PBP1A family penicillin-binding protein [Caulobacter sp. SLTY]